MNGTSQPNHEPTTEVTDPKDVDPEDGTDENDRPIDNPSG